MATSPPKITAGMVNLLPNIWVRWLQDLFNTVKAKLDMLATTGSGCLPVINATGDLEASTLLASKVVQGPTVSVVGDLPTFNNVTGNLLSDSGILASTVVIGPATATDNAIARYHQTTGKIIQNSLATIDDSGSVNIPTSQTYKINGTAHTHTLSGITDFVITSEERGDILYRGATNWVNLHHGTAGQLLSTGGNGADPSWATATPANLRKTIETGTTYTVADTIDWVIANRASTHTTTLPKATGSGRVIVFSSINTGPAVLEGDGTETIDGDANQSLEQYESITVGDYTSGAWKII